MITCDWCKKPKSAEDKRFPSQCIANISLSSHGKSGITKTIWRGDACEQCFEDLAKSLQATVTAFQSTIPKEHP